MIARFTSIVFFALLFALPLSGQDSTYTIEEMWTTPPIFGMPGNTRKVQTRISQNKIRRDEADSSQIVLMRADLGKLWMVRPKDRTYMEMDRETLQGLSMMALMLFGIGIHPETGKPSIPDSLFLKTGKQSRIGSWNCEEVRVRSGAGRTIVLWMSPETGLESGFYGRILKSLMGDYASDYGAFFKQLDALSGYPVLIESGAGGKVFSQKLISVRKEIVPESVYEVRKGYKKLDGMNNP